jgi:lycopene beta-cyclase
LHSSSAKTFDAILAGGGAAGLSLAYRLNQAMPEASLLIVDEAVKDRNDHTWCYWSCTPSYLDAITYRTWDRLAVIAEQQSLTLDLAPYRYHMVRSIDFYRFMREQLATRPNVQFQRGTVETVVEGDDFVEIVVNELAFHGRWLFDSRYRPEAYRSGGTPGFGQAPPGRRHHALTQHFLGWEIETDAPSFDPKLPTMFDFRTPQQGAMRFFYVLPFSPQRALVEYTLFSAQLLTLAEYQSALRVYLSDILGLTQYRILEEERSLIPMTDQPFPRRTGRRVLNTGTRGGRVKASSGYAFDRIQRDALAIARSLQRHGHPFDLPTSPSRYRLFDAMLLDILQHHGELGAPVFSQLFRRNPVQRIFRFLDEEGGWDENFALMASVPPLPFMRAWLRVQFSGSSRIWSAENS